MFKRETDGIDLVTFLQRVECRKGRARLGPQRCHDQPLAAGGRHHLLELGMLPGINPSAVGYSPNTSISGWDVRVDHGSFAASPGTTPGLYAVNIGAIAPLIGLTRGEWNEAPAMAG